MTGLPGKIEQIVYACQQWFQGEGIAYVGIVDTKAIFAVPQVEEIPAILRN
jgi:hypothetical protein